MRFITVTATMAAAASAIMLPTSPEMLNQMVLNPAAQSSHSPSEWDTLKAMAQYGWDHNLEAEDFETDPSQFDVSSFEEIDFMHPHKKYPTHNATVWELISKANFTSTFAKLASNFTDVVDILNSTKHNVTVFVNTNRAFKHLPKHFNVSDIPKKILEKALLYHIVPGLYPAPKVVLSHTLPTLAKSELLGGYPQRLRVGLGLKGVTLNFHSPVIPTNTIAKNGIIHLLAAPLGIPPPSFVAIRLLPTVFSQLELALVTTGLEHALHKVHSHEGGTFFAPTNDAFKRLGPRLNAFLFSPAGTKYLKALLLYHLAPNQTLYSDAFYSADSAASMGPSATGYFHVDLETALEKPLAVDVKSFGRYTDIIINGFTKVSVLDGILADGVLQVVPSVLIPPRKHGAVVEAEDYESMSIEDLKSRLDGAIGKGQDQLDL
jgi:uncharacterized surface protein with fasciclin (FAS1) repeats